MLLLALLTTAFAKELHDNLRQSWFWETSPDIEICSGSNIGMSEVIESIEFWRKNKIDLDIKSITYVESCDFTKTNVIQITGDISIPKRSIAVTNLNWYQKRYDTTRYIKRVRVQFPEKIHDYDPNEVLYHEFGHALGLQHSLHPVMSEF